MATILDPKADAAALEPIEKEAMASLTQATIPALGVALQAALQGALDGLTITIQVSKK